MIFVFPTVGQTAVYKQGPVTNAGSIQGKVTFKGPLPEDAIEKIGINKNPDVCDKDGTGFREVVWVDVKDGALRGSFVFIDKIEAGKKWPKPKAGKYIINQKGCRFRPWAQVVKPGPITIRHSDPDSVLHNINTREMIGVEKGRIVFMMAPKHPYAVVVNEDGTYSLDDVPPGQYTVKAWHPRFGTKKATVTVPASGKAQASFTFSK
jgi:hypothetical protein